MARRRAQTFPFKEGHNVALTADTLNKLGQVMAPTDSWDAAVQRLLAFWQQRTGHVLLSAGELEVLAHDQGRVYPTAYTVLTTQEGGVTPRKE